MATVYNTTFQLKRGTLKRWQEVNLVLEQGEPGFAYDANILKIGDGITAWNDLPQVNESQFIEIMTQITAIQELIGEIPVKEQIQQTIIENKLLTQEDAINQFMPKQENDGTPLMLYGGSATDNI